MAKGTRSDDAAAENDEESSSELLRDIKDMVGIRRESPSGEFKS